MRRPFAFVDLRMDGVRNAENVRLNTNAASSNLLEAREQEPAPMRENGHLNSSHNEIDVGCQSVTLLCI